MRTFDFKSPSLQEIASLFRIFEGNIEKNTKSKRMRHEGLIKRRMQDWIYMHVAVESPSDQSFFMSGFVTRMLNPTGTSSHRKYIIYTSMRKGVNTQSRVLDIEHAAFTSLIFTTTGGMGKECLNYHSRLAELIVIKKGEDYDKTCEIRIYLSQRN